jgi:SAM-dependent methyltransferase
MASASQMKAISSSWYLPVPRSLDLETRELFEQYSGLLVDDVLPHIIEVRNKAWSHNPYPCLGLFSFLSFAISSNPLYASTILPRLKQNLPQALLLDLGCGLGQDVRKLLHDGVSASRVYASDLSSDFLELGYDLFRDRDRLDHMHFLPADIFDDSPGSKLREWNGNFDIIHVSSFFHLFDGERQKWAIGRVIQLLKDQPGTLVVGHQIGADTQGVPQGTKMYRHDPGSWATVWEEVGKEIGTKWDVGVEIKELPMSEEGEEGVAFFRRLREQGQRLMLFWVERVE